MLFARLSASWLGVTWIEIYVQVYFQGIITTFECTQIRTDLRAVDTADAISDGISLELVDDGGQWSNNNGCGS